jgi:vancomycin aglycone glucosyltransferase
LIDDRPDCTTIGDVNQQALFPGSPPSCTTAEAGTTTAAARAGAAPIFSDQFY